MSVPVSSYFSEKKALRTCLSLCLTSRSAPALERSEASPSRSWSPCPTGKLTAAAQGPEQRRAGKLGSLQLTLPLRAQLQGWSLTAFPQVSTEALARGCGVQACLEASGSPPRLPWPLSDAAFERQSPHPLCLSVLPWPLVSAFSALILNFSFEVTTKL